MFTCLNWRTDFVALLWGGRNKKAPLVTGGLAVRKLQLSGVLAGQVEAETARRQHKAKNRPIDHCSDLHAKEISINAATVAITKHHQRCS